MKLRSAFAIMVAMVFFMLMLVNVAAVPVNDKTLGDGNARNHAAINNSPLRPVTKGGASAIASEKFGKTVDGDERNDHAMQDQPLRPLTPAGMDLKGVNPPKRKCAVWKFLVGWWGLANCLERKIGKGNN